MSSASTDFAIPDAAAPAFHLAPRETEPGRWAVRVEGRLSFDAGRALWQALLAVVPTPPPTALTFDLSGVEAVDGGSMALLVQTRWSLQATGVECAFAGATGTTARLLSLYGGDVSPAAEVAVAAPGFLAGVGARTLERLDEVRLLLDFVGRMVRALGGVLRHPGTANVRAIAPLLARTGADALPIVVLVTFLIGFVMGFQSAAQLEQFGADIYVADLVGLSITRELGPLMTAIIVSGRSGAAFAAELGTMSVSEEIDALRTLGIGPLRFLVFPRVLALVVALPLLTLFGDLMGLFGGLVVGVVNLDLSITAYLTQSLRALDVWDVFQGLIKAVVFGLSIGLIACAQGLATTGGAEGVGRRTTTAVVTSLFALILIDAAFTVTFHMAGL
jgi:phospholipid/cholesterol/gamma-HCH transport system permease protein